MNIYTAKLQWITYPISNTRQYVREQPDFHHQHRIFKNLKYSNTTGKSRGYWLLFISSVLYTLKYSCILIIIPFWNNVLILWRHIHCNRSGIVLSYILFIQICRLLGDGLHLAGTCSSVINLRKIQYLNFALFGSHAWRQYSEISKLWIFEKKNCVSMVKTMLQILKIF